MIYGSLSVRYTRPRVGFRTFDTNDAPSYSPDWRGELVPILVRLLSGRNGSTFMMELLGTSTAIAFMINEPGSAFAQTNTGL